MAAWCSPYARRPVFAAIWSPPQAIALARRERENDPALANAASILARRDGGLLTAVTRAAVAGCPAVVVAVVAVVVAEAVWALLVVMVDAKQTKQP